MTTLTDLFEQHAALTFEKQLALSEEIGDADWEFSMSVGTITFGGTKTYPIQILGTEADNVQTWLWGWANKESHIPARLLTCGKELKALGKREKIAEFTTPEIGLAQIDGRQIGTLATGICAADAFYRAPYEGGALYVLIDAPTLRTHRPTTAIGLINTFLQFIAQVPIKHRPAFTAYIAAKGGSTTLTADGLDATLPDGSILHATFDGQNRLTQLTTTQQPPRQT
jgi:hypothetical protein